MTTGPVTRRLADLVAAGKLAPDASQSAAAGALDRLLADLDAGERPTGVAALFRKPPVIRGVYLHGAVGRGKSMLMDLAFDAAPGPKRRRHFHEFMAEAHDAVNAWRHLAPNERKRHPHRARRADLDDPVPHVAHGIALTTRLLAFDEFEVTDIADAMLLGRLFEALYQESVVTVATSNRRPEELYKDGLNRELFLPFIRCLTARNDVVEIGGPVDYRSQKLAEGAYFRAGDAERRRAFDALWDAMTCVRCGGEETLQVGGRTIRVPKAWSGTARFSFADIAERPLGPRDYLAIAQHYHTIFLSDVPILSAAKRDAAKRFVTFVDALYEAKTKLIIEAAAEPDDLYQAGDYAFEFARTASRLKEMRSKDYLGERRRTLGTETSRTVTRRLGDGANPTPEPPAEAASQTADAA